MSRLWSISPRLPRRGRDLAKSAGEVPGHGCIQIRGAVRGAPLDVPGRGYVLRGRPPRARAEARLGDPLCADGGPVQSECPRHRLEVEAEWYIVAKNDRTVQPDLERFVAKRMGATTHEVASSHVPMLSHPDVVVDVIRAAAKSVQGSSATA